MANKITITLGGEELEELEEIVGAINIEQPTLSMTKEKYTSKIVNEFLQNRIKQEYEAHLKTLDVNQLRSALGSRKEIRANV